MIELFHAIGDEASAAARREIARLRLEERVTFRNIFYPEADADFRARGGGALPALWDGARLHIGLDAVLAQLSSLAGRDRE